MAPKAVKGKGKGDLRAWLSVQGFASRVLLNLVRTKIRRCNLHIEPAIIQKLRRGHRFNRRNDTKNTETHKLIAQYLITIPPHKQDEVMGVMFRGRVRGVFLDKVMRAYDCLVDAQIQKSHADEHRVLAVGPDNVIMVYSLI